MTINEIKSNDLSFKDTFNLGFNMYRMNFKAVAILSVIAYIPVLLLDRLVVAGSMRDLLMLLGVEDYGAAGVGMTSMMEAMLLNLANMPTELEQSVIRTTYIMLGAQLVSLTVFLPLISSGSTYLALENTKGEQGSIDGTLTTALTNIFKTFVTALLAFALITLGVMMFIVPGIYLTICFAFIAPAVIVTGKWGLGALKESLEIVQGRWFKTLAFLLLINAFGFVFMYMAAVIESVVLLVVPAGAAVSIMTDMVVRIALTYLVMTECLWFINKYFMLKAGNGN